MSETIGFISIGVAALIHASFQLSVSMLTLLSGHALGKKTAHTRLVRLTTNFIVGAIIMTLLLLSSAAFIIDQLTQGFVPPALWAISSGLLIGLGIAVFTLYYRKEPSGSTLWLPKSMAQFLTSRTKATRSSAEAFSLGLASIAAEFLFIIAPLLVAILSIIALPTEWQMAGIATYTIIATLPLLIVWILVGGGHSIVKIQKWREANKKFLRAVAGAGLLILGFFIYVEHIIGISVMGGVS